MPLPPAARRLARRAAARVGPLVPERLLSRVLSARSWAAEGTAVGLPPFTRVLAVAPHPDDESLGFGGTLALLGDRGARTTLVLCSDGESTLGSGLAPAEIARRRRSEATAAAALLGVADVRPLGYPDTGLTGDLAALSGELRGLLAEIRPDLVLLPWFLDASDDHRAVNLALVAALPPEDCEIWGAAVWTPVLGTRLVDISTVVDRKRAALAAHVTAAGAFDLSAMLGLNRYLSLHGLRGHGFAESFMAAPAHTYCALVTGALAVRGGRVVTVT